MMRLQINGKELTIDGVADDTPLLWVLRDELNLVGTKFGCGIAQCGYCQSGQLMSATALLAATPDPTDAQIDSAMAGNICRCGTYGRIKKAIKAAAQAGKGQAGKEKA